MTANAQAIFLLFTLLSSLSMTYPCIYEFKQITSPHFPEGLNAVLEQLCIFLLYKDISLSLAMHLVGIS